MVHAARNPNSRPHRRRRPGRARARRRSRLARHRLSADRAVGRLDLSAAHGPGRHPHHGVLPALGPGRRGRGLALSARPAAGQRLCDEPRRLRARPRAHGRRSMPRSPRPRARSGASAVRRTCSIRSCATSPRRSRASTLRYRTRLVSFTQDRRRRRRPRSRTWRPARASASVRSISSAATAAAAWCARRSASRMVGTAALTYTTNVIFRCPGLVALHDKGRAYRFIILGPGRHVVDHRGDQRHRPVALLDHRRQRAARLHDRGDPRPDPPRGRPRLRLRDPHRHAVGAARAGGRALRRGPRASWRATPSHMLSPTGAFGMNTGIQDAVDLSWKLAAVLQGWGGAAAARLLRRRAPSDRPSQRARGGRQLPPHDVAAAGAAACSSRRRTATRSGKSSAPSSPRSCATNGSRSASISAIATTTRRSAGRTARRRRRTSPTATCRRRARAAARRMSGSAPGRSTLDLFGHGFALLGFGADAADVGRSDGRGPRARRPGDLHGDRPRGGGGALRTQARAGAAGRPRRLARRSRAATMRSR